MLFCLPFCQADIADAKRLLEWISTLGGCAGHKCVLIADQDCDWFNALECHKIANECFDSANIISDGHHVSGWITGGNSKFKAAAQYAEETGQDFYFNEPDAIPLKFGWLDEIEKAYRACGKAFMGGIVHHSTPNFPNPYMEGASVYSNQCWKIVKSDWKDEITWVNQLAPIFVPNCHPTKLIHNVWGEFGNPPVFAERNVPGTSVFSLKNIPAEAVVFHRSKGGSLIRQLQRARGVSHPLVVVFPVCPNDINLALAHARWLKQMGRKHDNLAKIVFDATIQIGALTELRNLLEHSFGTVDLFKYPVPPVHGWPMAPNWAFQQVARHMILQDNPWLWFEADCVALTPDWLEKLDDEYYIGGRSWMGPVVKGMGHVNGVCVYPPDAALRSPSAMAATNHAWDYVMRAEMVHDCHDASHLMGHIWSILNGEAIETGGGETPDRVTLEQAQRWIKPSWKLVHRIKSADLTNLLIRGEYRHE